MLYSIAFYIDSVPFTEDVVARRTSLGGSESACLGLADALARRGHDVHLFVEKLDHDPGIIRDVQWHRAEELDDVLAFHRPDVFVSLRMIAPFARHLPAKCRVLWAQDLLIDTSTAGAIGAVDAVVFVSQFHREQWIGDGGLEWARPITWVTTNGYDPADLPDPAPPRHPRRFIYASRPERGLDALLAYWPVMRQRWPDATLAICRYSSMYDAAGWGRVCAAYDARVADVHARVGGIEWLGELAKPDLYRAIASSAAMLYPTSQPGFAETNCLLATEAQACGTPFVGHARGALPETLDPGAGILLDVPDGAWAEPAHVEAWCHAVDTVLDPEVAARMGAAGRAKAAHATHDVVAGQWEDWLTETFADRVRRRSVAIVRQLVHRDALRAADALADTLLSGAPVPGVGPVALSEADRAELLDVRTLCARVRRQESCTAEDYTRHALADTLAEARGSPRFEAILDLCSPWVSTQAAPVVIDVACGNGALALRMAEAWPNARIIALDYAPKLIEQARKAWEAAGVADRIEGRVASAWDATRETPTLPADLPPADLVVCGEFLEHVWDPAALVEALERLAAPNGWIVYTMPCGPFAELLTPGLPHIRAHVSSFDTRDIVALFGEKRDAAWSVLPMGRTPRGSSVGHWIVAHRPGGGPAGRPDDVAAWFTERPYERVTATMIVKNEAANILRCLPSIWPVVDRIVVADFGSTDGTPALIRAFAGRQPERVVVESAEWPDDFAEARNLTVARAEALGTDWIFWIDADEILDGAPWFRTFTESPVVNAVVVEQRHVAVDVQTYADKPLRLFRAHRGVRFFGPVHEQPEERPDAGITPAVHQARAFVIHTGYLTDGVRRQKMLARNLRLLLRAVRSGQPRELDWLLLMRDHVALCAFAREEARGALTPVARAHLDEALAIWDRFGWADPGHRFHAIAWPIYQDALTHLPTAIEIGWAFGSTGGHTLRREPALRRFRVRTAAEAEAYLGRRIAAYAAQLRPPTVRTAPVVAWAGPKVSDAVPG
jgi:glycosyltransferase involved in cell wall biosynthesis/2-polyprenyl-3-methyl-5-hydroxy-6-metoxy-1,4-benzoquinol methylase